MTLPLCFRNQLRMVLSLATLFVFLLLATPARAQGEAPPAEREWYGWQTLLPDMAAFGLTALALKQPDPTAPLVAAGGIFVLGGPLVHGANHQRERAVNSFLVRLFVPSGIAAGTVGLTAACSSRGGGWGCLTFLVAGGVVGAASMVVISIVDSVLAYKPKALDGSRGQQPRWGVVPTLDPRSGSYGAALVGRL
jgi:hypothetical protein